MQAAAHRREYSIANRADNLTFHWAKHVLLQEQWNPSLTASQYRQSLNDVIYHSETEMFLSVDPKQRGMLYFLERTDDAVSPKAQGRNAASEILVVCEPEIGKIRTGFMLPDTSRTREQRGIWLRRSRRNNQTPIG